jgi:hypothetical protein
MVVEKKLSHSTHWYITSFISRSLQSQPEAVGINSNHSGSSSGSLILVLHPTKLGGSILAAGEVGHGVPDGGGPAPTWH